MTSLGMRWNPYDYEGNLWEDPHGEESLDPVPPSLSGCVDVIATLAAAKELKCAPLTLGVEVLASKTSFENITQPDLTKLPSIRKRDGTTTTSTGRSTAWTFLTCLITLVSWQLLVENIEHKEIYCLASFFTVTKSNGLLRCIFDCRVLNSISKTPPPVNLAPIPDIMTLAAEIGITHVVTSDFKHFFFQLGLPEGVGQYFGFRCTEKETSTVRYFLSRVLSMGYSWSPYLAQCFSWTCILRKPSAPRKGQTASPYLGIDYSEIASLDTLPPYVFLRDGTGRPIGFITVVYDNIGVFTNNKQLAVQWSQRLLSNAKALKFWFKEMSVGSPSSPVYVVDVWNTVLQGPKPPKVLPSPDEKEKRRKNVLITFLGVQMDFKNADHPFRWRHAPEKLEKWTTCFVNEPHTHRDVARIVGICVWDCVISNTPFSVIAEAIGALRHCSRATKTKSDWDRPLAATLPKDTLKDVRDRISPSFLNQQLQKLRQNPWIIADTNTQRELFLMASDATNTRIAGVWLSEQGRVIKHFGRSLTRTHIYIKECQGIDATVRWIQKHRGSRTPAEFRIAVDNKAANAAARYCYSSNESVCKLFRSLHSFMQLNNIKLVVVDCHTKLNVADCPSRRKKITSQLAAATTDVLLGVIAGRPGEHELIEPGLHNDERPSVYLEKIARECDVEVIVMLEDTGEELWDQVNDMCDSHYLDDKEDLVQAKISSLKRSRD